jgi:hypothetical protein
MATKNIIQFFSFGEVEYETYLPHNEVINIMKTWVEEEINDDEIRFYELDIRTKFIGEVEKDRFELTRNIKINSGNFKDTSITPKIKGQILPKNNFTRLKVRFTTGKVAGCIYACLILLPLIVGIFDLENFGSNAFLGFVFAFGISLFFFGEKALILHFMKKELALKKTATP